MSGSRTWRGALVVVVPPSGPGLAPGTRPAALLAGRRRLWRAR